MQTTTTAMFIFSLGDDLALIPRTPAIAEPFHALLVTNHARLKRWDPGACADPLTLDNTRTRLQINAHGWLAGTQVPVAVALREGDRWRLVGAAALGLDGDGRTGEIGYWIDGGFEGRGLAGRAVTALLDHAFEALKLHRVTLSTDAANTRSRALAERLGFAREGVRREAIAGPEGPHDEVLYGLLAAEWRIRRRSRP